MRIAYLISSPLSDFNKQSALYKLSWPLKYYDKQTNEKYRFKYLVITISGVNEEDSNTSIFGSDKYGNIIFKKELRGSMPGTHTHFEVLKEVGYTLLKNNKNKDTPLKTGHLGWIIVGFILSLMGGYGGAILGANYAFGKYTAKTRTAGWIMLIISVIVVGLTIAIKNDLKK